MALPVSTLDPEEKKRQTTNLPYVQPGQILPLQQQPPIEMMRQGAPTPPPTAPAPPPTAPPPTAAPPTAPKPPTFDAAQAAALAAVPPPPPPGDIQDVVEEKAMEGFTSEEMKLLNDLVARFLQDPTLGRDPELAKQKALDEFNKQRAQGFEAYRQATGGQAGLGVREEELLSMQLAGAQERAGLKRTLSLEEEDIKRQQMLQALAIGTENVALQQAIFAGDIDAMIRAAGGALGFADLAMRQDILLSQQEYDKWKVEYQGDLNKALQSNDIDAVRENMQFQLDFNAQQANLGREFTSQQSALDRALSTSLAHLDIDAQREMINLKAIIDKDMLMTGQDFAAAQSELERLQDLAIQNNDITAQFALQEAQNEFAAMMLENEQNWRSAERVATQDWSHDERLSEQDFKHGMQILDQQHDLAVQDKDLQMQWQIEENRTNLQLQLQTQEMEHDEKMTYLDNELAEAFADNDVERQKDLMGFQQSLLFEEMEKEHGYDVAMEELNKKLQEELDNNNFENTKVLQKQQFEHELQMHDDNMRIKELQLALEERGLDMMQIQAEYDRIVSEIEAGRANPDDAINYLNKTLEDSGGTPLTPPDPMAWQDSMNEDYLMQQYQFALNKGLDMAAIGNFDDEGNFLGLQDQYLQQYQDWMNDTLYGTSEGPYKEIVQQLKNGEQDIGYFTGKSSTDPVYQALLAENTTVGWTSDRKTVGSGSSERHVFVNMPSTGGFLRYGNTVFQLSSKRTIKSAGRNEKEYTLVNVLTGEKFTINTLRKQEAIDTLNKYIL